MTTSTGNTKVDNAIDEFFGTLEGLLFPKAETAPEEDLDVDTKPEEDTEPINTETLASEAVRVLKKAETVSEQYPNGSDALVQVADRYIRILELVLIHG